MYWWLGWSVCYERPCSHEDSPGNWRVTLVKNSRIISMSLTFFMKKRHQGWAHATGKGAGASQGWYSILLYIYCNWLRTHALLTSCRYICMYCRCWAGAGCFSAACLWSLFHSKRTSLTPSLRYSHNPAAPDNTLLGQHVLTRQEKVKPLINKFTSTKHKVNVIKGRPIQII